MESNSPRVSRSGGIPTQEVLLAKLDTMLKEEFLLEMLQPFTVVVEGLTDLEYLRRAVELAHAAKGIDLLAIPKSAAYEGTERIEVITPRKANDGKRGGTVQMVRLAEELRSYVFTLEMFAGLVFVFDHDEEGQRAGQQIGGMGYKPDINSITLDPKCHPLAARTKGETTVESLLSLDIQRHFFDLGSAWCSIDYEAGVLKRYMWKQLSKGPLCKFVCEQGTWSDVVEIARIVARIRDIYGFPTDEQLFVA